MTKNLFRIDQRLLDDCHYLCLIEHFHVLLHKNASIPWLILVPESQVKEIHQLPLAMHKTFIMLANHITDHFVGAYGAEKMNIAALGNIVDQLHVHVIARKSSDACWPNVVWGQEYTVVDYDDSQIAALKGIFDRFMHREIIS